MTGSAWLSQLVFNMSYWARYDEMDYNMANKQRSPNIVFKILACIVNHDTLKIPC